MNTPQPPLAGLPEADAHLRQALRHAPEPATPPAPVVREAVLAYATKSVATQADDKASSATNAVRISEPWGRRLQRLLGLSDLGTAGWAGAMASLMLAVLVGILWSDDTRREQAEDMARAPDAPAPTPAAAPPAPSVPTQPAPAEKRAEVAVARKADAAAPQRARVGAAGGAAPELKKESLATSAPAQQDKVLAPASPAQENAIKESPLPAPKPAVAPESPAAGAPPVGQVALLAKKARSEHQLADAAAADSAPAVQAAHDATLKSLAASSVQCRTEPVSDCNADAARALLRSPLLRRVLATAQPDTAASASAGATPSLALHWYADGAVTPSASLIWHALQRRLVWHTPPVALTTTVTPEDASSLQARLDSIAVR